MSFLPKIRLLFFLYSYQKVNLNISINIRCKTKVMWFNNLLLIFIIKNLLQNGTKNY
jgi:hypothetical protein